MSLDENRDFFLFIGFLKKPVNNSLEKGNLNQKIND
jgi:hypothetical protein